MPKESIFAIIGVDEGDIVEIKPVSSRKKKKIEKIASRYRDALQQGEVSKRSNKKRYGGQARPAKYALTLCRN